MGFQILQFSDELKIKNNTTGHWAWFAPDGRPLQRGTASAGEIQEWSKVVPSIARAWQRPSLSESSK